MMAEIVEKATMRNPGFWVCLSLSIALIVTGFLVPPTGKIDGSVLTSVGELFGFATLEVVTVAIKKGIDAKVRHGNTELSVGDFNDEKKEEINVSDT